MPLSQKCRTVTNGPKLRRSLSAVTGGRASRFACVISPAIGGGADGMICAGRFLAFERQSESSLCQARCSRTVAGASKFAWAGAVSVVVGFGSDCSEEPGRVR